MCIEEAVVSKAAGRVLDGLERRIGRQLPDLEVDQIFKAIVNRPYLRKLGDVDLWGSKGRTGTETSDDALEGHHTPTSSGKQMDYDGGGHPGYSYSRPLEGEDKLRRLVGKASTATEDEAYESGAGDPTAFSDETGGADSETEAEPLRDEDTGPPTGDHNNPIEKSDPSQNRPIRLEVSDTFEDAPGVEVEVQSKQKRDAYSETDTRGQPVNLAVGSQDAVAIGQLHRTMFRRMLRDKKFDLAVVVRKDDGTVEILEESLG